MNSKIEDLKHLLKTLNIDWNSLFEAKFNSKTYTSPFYFGVYRVMYYRGYENAEKNFKIRLNGLITHLDTLEITSPIAIKCLVKIKAFQENLLTVYFRSEAFKADCRTSLLKNIRPLTRTRIVGNRNEIQKTETLVDPKEFKLINKLYHQLSPFNYSYSYLTHFFYISDTDITTLLVDDVTNSANVDFDLEVYEAASRVGDSTLVMRESEIQSVANEFYQSLSETLSPEELARLNTPDGFSSSYYIAVWTLMRLGRLRHPDFPEEQISTHIINVLPETWRKGEEESLSIIRQSPFSDAAKEVEYVWF